MEDYSNTKKLLLSSLDEEKTTHLRVRFDELLKQVRMPTDSTSKDNSQSIYQWVVPKHILCFLKNVLNENITFKLMSWIDFKLQLYDFYDHRLLYQNEVAGATNNFYMNLDEYILLYFLDKYKFRNQAEFKLMEMLVSLKYYWDLWPRARTFGLMTSFLKPMIQDVNIAKNQPQLTIYNIDIYIQEFYLHAYSILVRSRESFYDSKDGITYMKLSYEENATQSLMTWFGEVENRKWFSKIRRAMKRIKVNPNSEEQEQEYIDVDALLDMYFEEFQLKKKQILKDLQKEFMKKFAERKDGVFSTDEVDRIIQ